MNAKRWLFSLMLLAGLVLAVLAPEISSALAQDADPPAVMVAEWAAGDAGAAPLAADAGPAAALPNLDTEAGGLEFAQRALDAAMSKNYMGLSALMIIALVYLARRFGSKRLPFLATDRGGALLVMFTSIAGAVTTPLLAGQAFTGDMLLRAVYLGFMAAGGWSWARRMFGVKSAPPPV